MTSSSVAIPGVWCMSDGHTLIGQAGMLQSSGLVWAPSAAW
jgi:hypothetical protein